MRQLQCEEPVEKLYYSMGYEPICIYCSSEDNLDIPNDSYPICEFCKGLGNLLSLKECNNYLCPFIMTLFICVLYVVCVHCH